MCHFCEASFSNLLWLYNTTLWLGKNVSLQSGCGCFTIFTVAESKVKAIDHFLCYFMFVCHFLSFFLLCYCIDIIFTIAPLPLLNSKKKLFPPPFSQHWEFSNNLPLSDCTHCPSHINVSSLPCKKLRRMKQ